MKSVIDWLFYNYGLANQQKVVDAYKEAMTDRVLEDLRRFCLVYGTTAVSGDEPAGHRNEGRRQVYLHIADIINLKAESLITTRKGEDDDRRDEPRPE